MYKDTITAIATSLTTSGIGIIRISGKESFDIIDKIFRPANTKKIISKQKSHTIHYGHIVDDNEILDEVLVSIMKAPNTFTREDVVEINCHGGIIVIQKVLEVVLRNGARIAEPGEFTKRAFLNGRIDLSQAEAVIDIINAKTELSLKSSIKQLEGKVSEKIKFIRHSLLEKIAFIEASIDYPEDEIEELTEDRLSNDILKIKDEIQLLLNSADNGRMLKEGIRTVIVGKPNVGKSSLLNAILREQRAIVTEIAGTTRDTLEEYVNINGIPLNIIDTAGIRETSDIVEKIGVEKSIKYINEADLIIFVVDVSTELDENDYDIIDKIKEKNVIVLLNKIDLNIVTDINKVKELLDKDVVEISAKENTGIDILESKLKNMFFNGEIDFNDEIYITNVRHKNCLESSINSLNLVLDSINMGMPEDCYSIDLQNAYESLGEIIGESVGESLIDQIFSQFCLGK